MAPFLCLVPSVSLLVSSSNNCRFQFVPYGESIQSSPLPAADDSAILACDGRVPGATLELSHWNGNTTPKSYYADTSTEIALNCFATETYRDATIVNNHFDSDGVLSVFACLEPQQATQYRDLIIAGAEAGDFGEWSSDAGVQLDCALSTLLENSNNDDETAYETALEILPSLLNDLAENGGQKFKELWKDGFTHAEQSYQEIETGKTSFEQGPGGIVLVHNEPYYLSPYAIHRGLRSSGLVNGVQRLLRQVNDAATPGQHHYYYELPGHGWVRKLVQRQAIATVDDSSEPPVYDDHWSKGGLASLVAITHGSTAADPHTVASRLLKQDVGAA